VIDGRDRGGFIFRGRTGEFALPRGGRELTLA